MKVRYFHCRAPELDESTDTLDAEEILFVKRLEEAVEDATKRGQIKEHRRPRFFDNIDLIDAFTMAVIEDDDRNELARGYAFCGPGDQFCRKTGRMIALNRAKAEL